MMLVFDYSQYLDLSSWGDDQKMRATKAASYLEYVSKMKGEAAFDLSTKLLANLNNKEQEIVIPDHIKAAIAWVC